MGVTQPLKIDFYPNRSSVGKDDSSVDAWELKASRRALKNLKTLLCGKQMQDLIQQQIDQGDAYYKEIVAASGGQYKECRVDLSVTGITATQMLRFRQKHMKMLEEASQEVKDRMALDLILSAHPEHYMFPPYPEGIVEVIGEHMARLRIRVTEDVPDFVMEYGDPEYPMKKPTVGELDDGTVLFYILHEFRDTKNGCDLILRLLFPAAASQVFFDEHAEHLCIEFRRGIQATYQDVVEEAKGG
jgi:hypothetical protein